MVAFDTTMLTTVMLGRRETYIQQYSRQTDRQRETNKQTERPMETVTSHRHVVIVVVIRIKATISASEIITRLNQLSVIKLLFLFTKLHHYDAIGGTTRWHVFNVRVL